MALPIVRIILYVKNIPKVAAFYERHFGMHPLPSSEKGWLEMTGASGPNIALHQAASTQKSGAAVKIVFGISDVRSFKAERERHGLKFGSVHDAGGFEFANAKDPAGNSIQISSRGMN
jgi:catechol 2,3-dioxygenase-like lactoylglutathione lyase family enzyme